MPIYEYRCKNCNTQFEMYISNKDNEVICPECREKNVEKILSSGIFTGRLDTGNCGPGSSGGFS